MIISTAWADDYYYPKTDIFSVSTGIYYDNPNNINSLLKKIIMTDDFMGHVYYFGISYKVNHNPIISNKPYFLLYSLDFKFPITRKTSNVYYNAELQTYSLSAELSVFESYMKIVTVHPVIGIGFSKTELLMPIKYNEEHMIHYLDNKMNKYEKSNLNLILGGGCDLRINIRESEQEVKNFLISFEVKYALNLDVLKILDGKWQVGSSEVPGLPDYTLPGLSIELKLGIENQRK